MSETIVCVSSHARPWHVERDPAYGDAPQIVDAAGYTVCEMENDDESSMLDAELIVEAVNNYRGLSSPDVGAWPKKPKPTRIECPPDLQAARADSVEE